jgi:hypothetical protein
LLIKRKVPYWNPPPKIIGIGSLDILKRNGLILMVCFGPTKISMDPNDLPLMKALHGENVDEMELFIQNYKKEQGTK